MSFDLENYKQSLVYKSYESTFSKPAFKFNVHSPYEVLNNMPQGSEFKEYMENKLFSNLDNTFYFNILPYYFIYHACSDTADEIFNKNKKISQLKFPLDYFSSGKLFGLENIENLIKNGLDPLKIENWGFNEDFQILSDNKSSPEYEVYNRIYGTSNTDDLEKNLEALYFNNLFRYFLLLPNTSPNKYKNNFGLNLTTEFLDPLLAEFKEYPELQYSKKGYLNDKEIVDEQTKKIIHPVGTKYTKGSGEAPNFPDVSVNSFQKIKNKILLKARATKNSYNSNISAPRKIIIKNGDVDVNSGIVLENEDDPVNNFYEKYYSFNKNIVLSPASKENLKTITNAYISNVSRYFNLVHFLLKSAILNYQFISYHSQNPDSDIFDLKQGQVKLNTNQLGYEKQDNNQIIKDVKIKYSSNAEVKKLGIYLKNLIVNLLNIVGDEKSVENKCNVFLELLEQNEPEVAGIFNKKEIKETFLKLEKICFSLHYSPEPRKIIDTRPSDFFGSRPALVNIITRFYNFGTFIQHSSDLIVDKMYVYRMEERPFDFQEILSSVNLYKIVDFEKKQSENTINPSKKNLITFDDSVSFIEDIIPNKKYYYCFLSQREYNVFEEILPIESKNLLVEHFSSPTKILELEMISTENSTYLEYNFYTPEQKEKLKAVKNFLSKIRISPSQEQKSYNSNTKNFNIPIGLMPFWTKVTNLINSDDTDTGLTIKLRFTSPKTKKKFDINVRHFLRDQYTFPQDMTGKKYDSDVTKKDIENYTNNKKYKEVFSQIQPAVSPDLLEVVFTEKKPVDLSREILYTVDKTTNKYKFTTPAIFPVTKISKTDLLYVKNLKFYLEYYVKNSNNYKLIDFINNYSSKETKKESDTDYTVSGVGLYSQGIVIRDILTAIEPQNNFKILLRVEDNNGLKLYKEIELPIRKLDPKILSVNVGEYLKDKAVFAYNESAKANVEVDDKNIYGPANINIDEGKTLRFVIQTKDLNDKELNWQIKTTSGLIETSDFDGVLASTIGSNTPNASPSNYFKGTVGIKNNKGVVEFKISEDNFKDSFSGDKFYLQLDETNFNLLASSPIVSINDTSVPTPIYQIGTINNQTEVLEGQSITFTISVKDQKTNKNYDTNAPFSVRSVLADFISSNINVSDTEIAMSLSTGTKTASTPGEEASKIQDWNFFPGNVYIPSDPKTNFLTYATLTVKANANMNFGDSKDFQLVLRDSSGKTLLGGVGPKIKIVDVTPSTYSITSDKETYNEGETAKFTINTTGVKDGTKLFWEVKSLGKEANVGNPVNSSDFNIFSGDVEIKNSKGEFTINILADQTTEGLENFYINLKSSQTGQGLAFVSYKVININDTSLNIPQYIIDLKNYASQFGITKITTSSAYTVLVRLDLMSKGDFDKSRTQLQSKIWGGANSIYSSDSDFRLAAVHSGLANFGDTNVQISLTYKGKINNFIGSTKNGVQTNNFAGDWDAWQISKVA